MPSMLELQERDHCGCNGVNEGMKLGNKVREEMEPGHVGTVGFIKKILTFILNEMGLRSDMIKLIYFSLIYF